MTEEQNQVQHLLQRLYDLQEKQELFHTQILQLKAEIEKLRKMQKGQDVNVDVIPPETITAKIPEKEVKVEEKTLPRQPVETVKKESAVVPETVFNEEDTQSDIERFIGENLINKIGIAVTVIGVGIGAKYAIDHQLISPVTRIILGYLVGIVLLFFAVKLRKQYENFSAVLLSGSMAIMYFITYAAYSFFHLYPQMIAFFLMVIFTVFTVTAALRYNRKIIAIIGLVGAYAVPYLLSEGSEDVTILFSYITIINAGILVIAVRKYWKPLYFSAFVLSWLIYFSWYVSSYQTEKHLAMALIFLFLFFSTFYLTFLSYKLIKKEKFDIFDILLLLSNSFIFYGVGYSIIAKYQPGENLLGLFTLGNAVIHLIVSAVIYRNSLADRNLFFLVSGLVLVFLTIAIPVQLDGNWVTLLWISETTLLFYIGRTRSAPVYEFLSYPILLLSLLSIAQDWGKMGMDSLSVSHLNEFKLLNIQFLTSIIFIAAFAIIVWFYYSRKYSSPLTGITSLSDILNFTLPGLFIFVVYLAFCLEISTYWNYVITAAKNDITVFSRHNSPVLNDLNNYKNIWLINYSLLFFALLSFINAGKIKSSALGEAVFWLSLVTLYIFLFLGLYDLSELRESYISNQYLSDPRPQFNLFIRYICFVPASLLLASANYWIRKKTVTDSYRIIFNLLFHLSVIWVLSSEMLNIMDIMKNTHSYKFGLSILWGIYALMLIVLGIIGRKKHLRIAAMVLLGVTLTKLFFYDITRLDTILKTILFLALGFLLLLISFLYNKYNKYLFGETDD